MVDVADKFIYIATMLKPIIDIFVPSSPEYSVPYACICVIFKVSHFLHITRWSISC